jgi:hypothetical protein
MMGDKLLVASAELELLRIKLLKPTQYGYVHLWEHVTQCFNSTRSSRREPCKQAQWRHHDNLGSLFQGGVDDSVMQDG